MSSRRPHLLLRKQFTHDMPLSADALPTSPAIATADVEPTLGVHIFGVAAAATAAVWFARARWFCGRLFVSWRQLGRLRRAGRLAEPPTIETCRQIANRFNVTPPEVLHSPYLPSPCLAGFRRPAVMLPETELSLPVRDVLVHELAHLARRDCFWNLLRQAAPRCCFFNRCSGSFPAGWLRRRKKYVTITWCNLAATGANTLIAWWISRRSRCHRWPLRESESCRFDRRSARVSRIMDTSRSLSTRAGSLLLAIMLAAGMAATLLVGLVGLNPCRRLWPTCAEFEMDDSDDDRDVKDGNGEQQKSGKGFTGRCFLPVSRDRHASAMNRRFAAVWWVRKASR